MMTSPSQFGSTRSTPAAALIRRPGATANRRGGLAAGGAAAWALAPRPPVATRTRSRAWSVTSIFSPGRHREDARRGTDAGSPARILVGSEEPDGRHAVSHRDVEQIGVAGQEQVALAEQQDGVEDGLALEAHRHAGQPGLEALDPFRIAGTRQRQDSAGDLSPRSARDSACRDSAASPWPDMPGAGSMPTSS
jgi:hypothetical protein